MVQVLHINQIYYLNYQLPIQSIFKIYNWSFIMNYNTNLKTSALRF